MRPAVCSIQSIYGNAGSFSNAVSNTGDPETLRLLERAEEHRYLCQLLLSCSRSLWDRLYKNTWSPQLTGPVIIMATALNGAANQIEWDEQI
jgi:hypothetical protein